MRLNMNKKILDLVYCFDENYNIQGITSANSFLKNYKNQVRVHILHNNPNSIRSLSTHLKKFNNVEEVNIYEFKKPNDFVFRMNEEHIVTEATYYRLFIHEYLPDTISKVLYFNAFEPRKAKVEIDGRPLIFISKSYLFEIPSQIERTLSPVCVTIFQGSTFSITSRVFKPAAEPIRSVQKVELINVL